MPPNGITHAVRGPTYSPARPPSQSQSKNAAQPISPAARTSRAQSRLIRPPPARAWTPQDDRDRDEPEPGDERPAERRRVQQAELDVEHRPEHEEGELRADRELHERDRH